MPEAQIPAEAAAGLRTGEIAADLPAAFDAALYFIGRIGTPWTERLQCPRQGRLDGRRHSRGSSVSGGSR